MRFIKPLSQISKFDVAIAGGKAASLGEMLKKGIEVPPGFVVLSLAFDSFLEKAKLEEEILAILSSIKGEDVKAIEKASARIKALIIKAKVPQNISDEIIKASKALGAKRVAVRSSATSEDSAQAAWAGQLETYLNTTNPNIVPNVKKCWASLFSERAISYRLRNSKLGQKIPVAVVIQKMVKSEKAGVAFSVHPVTQDKNQIIIEGGFGLGDSVVSGEITPDSYVIAKNPRVILEKKLCVDKKQNTQVLSDAEILSLTELVLKIETIYGFPCDIEWAFERKKFYVTQSRPITTLSKRPKRLKTKTKQDLIKLFAREYSVQYCEASLRSLGYEFAQFLPKALMSQCYLPEKNNEAACFHPDEWSLFQNHLREIVADAKLAKQYLRDFHYCGEQYVAIASLVSRGNLRALNAKELISRFEEYIRFLNIYTCYLWKGFFLNELYSKEGASALAAKKIAKKDYNAILKALFSPSKKSGILLLQDEMSEKKRINGAQLSKKELKQFLKKYAWMPCLDIHNEPWDESQIENYYTELEPVMTEHLSYDSATKRALFNSDDRKLFKLVREFVYVKDMRDIYRRQGIYAAIALFDEIAVRLGLKRADLAYFTNTEIIQALKKANQVKSVPYKKRKKGFLIYWDKQGIKVSVRKMDIKKFSSRILVVDDQDNIITGTIASPGTATGLARIVHGIADLDKIKKNDIMVAVTTHPDFVPAMQRASAIVTDEGGLTSHAAIVAREMKKPCIVGTKVATQVIKEGTFIKVDGNSGIVSIEQP